MGWNELTAHPADTAVPTGDSLQIIRAQSLLRRRSRALVAAVRAECGDLVDFAEPKVRPDHPPSLSPPLFPSPCQRPRRCDTALDQLARCCVCPGRLPEG